MTNAFIQVAADGVGKKLDTDEIVVGTNTVHRQRVISMNTDEVASGSITILNSNPLGVATGGSAVELALGAGQSTLAIQVFGTYTGALSVQGTVNGTNWVTLTGAFICNLATGALTATIASAAQGIFSCDVTGLSSVRVAALAAVTGAAAITLAASAAESLLGLDLPLPAGANAIGSVTVASGNVANTPVAPTTTFTNSLATTNLAFLKASAGTLWSLVCSNTNASVRYVKLYNKASAPVLASDIPAIVIPIPPGGSVTIHGGSNGIRFATGIAIAIVIGAADNDATAVAAGEIKVATSFT